MPWRISWAGLDVVLDALELASPYTWHLSHEDLFGSKKLYGKDSRTPFVFTFCGDKTGFISRRTCGPGFDGVARIAGASLNTRKIELDFSRRHKDSEDDRARILPWTHEDSPVVPVKGANHGSIMDRPDAKLVDLVVRALDIGTWGEFERWHADAARAWWTREQDKPRFQQIVVRAIDERGDGIRDYAIKLFEKRGAKFVEVGEFDRAVSVYSRDPSFRCFHLDLNKLRPEKLSSLWVKVILDSGTHYSQWRCRVCVDAGRSGHLTITRIGDGGRGGER